MLYAKACLCEYSGTNYSGWQRQSKHPSVQKTLETSLSEIYNENILIAGSGRTDSGVHSLGQVFSFISNNYRTDETLLRGLNSILPKDIAVLDSLDVTPKFHAGKSSLSKTYIYKIINRPIQPALMADRVLWIRKPIDIEKLNDILANFVGEHDFESFCVKKTKKENTTRRVNFAYARKSDDLVEISINANGFLHNMVRIIVGTSIDILKRDENPNIIKQILESKARPTAGKTTEPQGLYQKEVFYNNEEIAGLKGVPEKFRVKY